MLDWRMFYGGVNINGDMSDTVFSLISSSSLLLYSLISLSVPDPKLGAAGRVWNKFLRCHGAGVGEREGIINNESFRVISATGK